MDPDPKYWFAEAYQIIYMLCLDMRAAGAVGFLKSNLLLSS